MTLKFYTNTEDGWSTEQDVILNFLTCWQSIFLVLPFTINLTRWPLTFTLLKMKMGVSSKIDCNADLNLPLEDLPCHAPDLSMWPSTSKHWLRGRLKWAAKEDLWIMGQYLLLFIYPPNDIPFFPLLYTWPPYMTPDIKTMIKGLEWLPGKMWFFSQYL